MNPAFEVCACAGPLGFDEDTYLWEGLLEFSFELPTRSCGLQRAVLGLLQGLEGQLENETT